MDVRNKSSIILAVFEKMKNRMYIKGIMKRKPVLYIKSGCPWCRSARAFLSEHGVDVDLRDVNANTAYMEEMEEISGQSKTPTLVDGDFIVADFSVDELVEELRQRPELLGRYGVSDDEDGDFGG